MNLSSFSEICFSFGVLLVAILALVKRKDRIAFRFLVFSIAVCGWGFSEALWLSENYSGSTTLMLARLGNASAVWIPIAWFHFVMDFIGEKEPVRFFYATNYLIALLLTVSSFSNLFISGLRSIADFKYYIIPNYFYYLFTGIFFILVPYGFLNLVKAYRLKPDQREQLKYFIAATIFGFFGGSTTFLPVYGVPFPLVFLPLMIVYPVLMGIGLVRHGLFDIERIAQAIHRDKLAAIGTLATSINHEIRNPLYVIRGIAETQLERVDLEKEKIVEKNSEAFQRTIQQADRALYIMKRFAVFAKQNTHVVPEFKLVELWPLLENILPLIQHELDLDKIELVKKIPKDLFVKADERHLEEILFNLIVNACQALKSIGGGIIEVAAQRVGGNVQITVTDNGPGIPETIRRQIFEPFYTTKDEGTGLGLYITKQLVERNRGSIKVNTEKDKTTSFILSFP